MHLPKTDLILAVFSAWRDLNSPSCPNHVTLHPFTATTVSVYFLYCVFSAWPTGPARKTEKAHSLSPTMAGFTYSEVFWAFSQHLFVLKLDEIKCRSVMQTTCHVKLLALLRVPQQTTQDCYSKEQPEHSWHRFNSRSFKCWIPESQRLQHWEKGRIFYTPCSQYLISASNLTDLHYSIPLLVCAAHPCTSSSKSWVLSTTLKKINDYYPRQNDILCLMN